MCGWISQWTSGPFVVTQVSHFSKDEPYDQVHETLEPYDVVHETLEHFSIKTCMEIYPKEIQSKK